MAERIIMALIKTGKPEVAPENSALDMCSVWWWPDVHEKEDSQWGQQGRMITKKYKVTETKEEKFQEAAINSA